MQMQEIRTIAKEHGINAGKTTKVNLIRKIQQVEGNYECFATKESETCGQMSCLWRNDCLSAAKKQ